MLALAGLAGVGLPTAHAAPAAAPAAAAPTAPPAPADLESLMRGMATTAGVIADFREVKELALLSQPIEVEGTLYFIPPDRLARTTRPPNASKLVIDGDRFSFSNEAGGEAVDLSDNPVARAFASNFIVLFDGDLAALRARYEPTFSTAGDRWTLVLRPRGRPLADVIERVTLAGTGVTLERIELVEKGGDRTTTTFSNVRVDHHFTPREQERIFGTSGGHAGEP
jgi:outer membrane lipoprotein-sorting protein